jgi:hypothetical protein
MVTGPNMNQEESIHGQHIPLIIGPRDDIYTLGEPTDMCVITKNHTKETWSIRRPVYTACDAKILKKVYIIAMTGHYRVNHSLIF